MSNSRRDRDDLLSSDPDPAVALVEHDVADDQSVVLGLASAPDGTQACVQLLEGERLDQVVIGTRFEPGDPLGHGTPRGQHQDRHVVALATELLAHLGAAHPGQHQVEHDRVDVSLTGGEQATGPVVGAGGADVVLPEVAGDELDHAWLVVDHDYVHGDSVGGR